MPDKTVRKAATNEPKPRSKPMTERTLEKAGPTVPVENGEPIVSPHTEARLNTPGS